MAVTDGFRTTKRRIGARSTDLIAICKLMFDLIKTFVLLRLQ